MASLKPTKPPTWLRELLVSLPIAPQFVLSGNVRDAVLFESDEPEDSGLPDISPSVSAALIRTLGEDGYDIVVTYDAVDGFSVFGVPNAAEQVQSTLSEADLALPQGGTTLDAARPVIRALIEQKVARVAVVIELASRIALNPENLSPEQLEFFREFEKAAITATPLAISADSGKLARFNPAIWICDNARDLPDWFTENVDLTRSIQIPLPDLGQRHALGRMLASTFSDYSTADEAEQRQQLRLLTSQTDGMTLKSMQSIAKLAREQGFGMRRIDDAARAHRVGILEDPWKKSHLRDRLKDAPETIRSRVIGQNRAIEKSLDIVTRSVTGMTKAHGSADGTRPRGVLFLAGPTGVGKTELAKALTQLLFENERAYVRFDMSEFASEHDAARLIGAPPGYTGFAAGGELTNAMRERPFSLVLFDEIEKADPRILDKFLQVLDDGRLTDGRGQTVYFTEAVLVFTSNLGIYIPDPTDPRRTVQNVNPEMEFEEIEARVMQAIEDHFNFELKRPELLNRIGNNIVVFDFIDKAAATEILVLLLDNVKKRFFREHRAGLELSDDATSTLFDEAVARLEHGGRGIGTAVESALVNPLARWLFDSARGSGGKVVVDQIRQVDQRFELAAHWVER